MATEVGSGSQRATQLGSQSNSLTKAYPADVVAGNLLVGGGATYRSLGSSSSWTVTDSLGTVYTVIVGDPWNIASGDQRVIAWYGIAPSSGPNTVTVSNDGGTPDFFSFSIDEFSGQGAFSTLGGNGSPGGSTESADLTSPTDNELIFGVMTFEVSATSTITAPATLIGKQDSNSSTTAHSFGFVIGGAAGAQSIEWTWNASVASAARAFSFLGTPPSSPCDGGGDMPDAAEITDSEDWAALPVKQPDSWMTVN